MGIKDSMDRVITETSYEKVNIPYLKIGEVGRMIDHSSANYLIHGNWASTGLGLGIRPKCPTHC